jgi:hypothetical protein
MSVVLHYKWSGHRNIQWTISAALEFGRLSEKMFNDMKIYYKTNSGPSINRLISLVVETLSGCFNNVCEFIKNPAYSCGVVCKSGHWSRLPRTLVS